jgi:uncharacterized membrane protein YraQ (UPF0718 family)
MVAFLPLGILINGVMNTYVGSAWTLTYLRLLPVQSNSAPVIAEPLE